MYELYSRGGELSFSIGVAAGGVILCYVPKPDLSYEVEKFPRIFVEVDSRRNEDDRRKMLTQMAYFLRNGIRVTASGAEDLFLMGLFMHRDWTAELYVVIVSNEGVCACASNYSYSIY